ncbi:lactonase family protein [Pengzhenrongella frigida]|uniref:Lactonase family protein n=1 Tax=Pengzhenrongella frigida TaxID=1259133 RepID=A0A4Q5MZR1_9MICO|nr:beta-propeller fold lactonase family protein [Cellulomonas sp. HLT2-17]RYV51216.1 lactonase family protein [Cellulomonas sp. HLT2-17]
MTTPPFTTPQPTTPQPSTPQPSTPQPSTPQTSSPRTVWIGTYPEAGAGTPAGLGEGIWRVALGALGVALPGPTAAGPVLAATTPAPSFLATHPGGRVLYAVGEQAAGTVTAFAAGPDGRLGALAVVSSGGADPCHLLLAPDMRTLYVTNYSSGSVGVLPLDVDGSFARATIAAGGPVQVLTHSGSGPDADRQEAPHAHSAAFAPGGAHLLVADLGTDELRRYRIAIDGRLTPDGIAATLPPGTGPRHLAVRTSPTTEVDRPDGVIYLVGELDVTVRVLRWDGESATATLIQTLPACGSSPRDHPADLPEPDSDRHTVVPERGDAATVVPERGDAASVVPEAADAASVVPVPVPSSAAAPTVSLPAHVVLGADRLLVSVRGADVLAEFEVDPRTGLLAPVAEVPAGGSWPRHFAVVDGVPLVANQHSDTITALHRPTAPTGPTTLTAPVGSASIPIPAPACVVPAI